MTKQIQIPTTCPSCDFKLEQVNSQLFCRNKECPAQSTKKVEAFIKKMRIKGLGPASISKLGFVRPIEIYETPKEVYVEILGDKIGQKVFNEVENSTLTTFATFLSALSIPLIGESASKKVVAAGINSIHDFFNVEYIEGLGNKAEATLYNYIDNNFDELAELENYLTIGLGLQKIGDAAIKPGSNGTVCITGKLNDFSNRTKAKEFLEEHGYTVTNAVTSKTDYLVCEDGSESSKSKKAESLGIPIVSIVNLTGKY